MNSFDPNVIIGLSLITIEMVLLVGSCDDKALNDCYSRLRQSTDFRQMEKNDTIFPTWNDSQLDLLCRAMAAAKNCVINVTVHCSSAEFQIYKGSNEAISYVCDEGRQQYREVRECFQKDAVRLSKDRCHGNYLVALDELHRSVDRSHDEKVVEICRTIDRSIDCIRRDINVACGEEAAKWTEIAMHHQQRPAKEELRCHALESQMNHLSPPIIFGIILLLLLATTICIMTTLLVYRILHRHRSSSSSSQANHHRLNLHHQDIVKYNCAGHPKNSGGGSGGFGATGCGGSLGDVSGGRPGGGSGTVTGGGRTFDHLTVPLILSQSGLSATGKSADSTDDISCRPSNAGDG